MAGTTVTPSNQQYFYPDSWTNLTNSATNYAAGFPTWFNDVYENWYDQPVATGETSNLSKAYSALMNPNGQWTQGINNAIGQGSQWSENQGNAQDALQPWEEVLNSALSTTQGANPVFQSAQGQLQQGAKFDPSQLQQFMNPYVNDAANSLISQSNRNLTENILPAINSTFVGNGQFGSSRNADFTNRALRDQQQTLTNSLGQLDFGAAKDAISNYSDWANKGITSGQSLTNLGSAIGQNGLAQSQIGSGFGNLSASYNNLGSGALNYMKTLGDLSSTGNSINQSQLGSMLTGAQSEQQILQQQLDKDYSNWTTQQQYPLGALSAVSQGIANMSAGVKPNTYDPQQQPDNFTRLLALIQASGKGLSDPSIQYLINSVMGEN